MLCWPAYTASHSHPSPNTQFASSILLQVNSTQEMERLWRDYFVVTFVRNPYQRAVSSYRMMARQLVPGGAQSAGLSWGAFCADPTCFADTCMADEQCRK